MNQSPAVKGPSLGLKATGLFELSGPLGSRNVIPLRLSLAAKVSRKPSTGCGLGPGSCWNLLGWHQAASECLQQGTQHGWHGPLPGSMLRPVPCGPLAHPPQGAASSMRSFVSCFSPSLGVIQSLLPHISCSCTLWMTNIFAF